jgi:hypothetical protein
MYSCLDDYGKKRNLITDQTKFPCPSLVQPHTPNFYNYELLPTNQTQQSYHNKEYFAPEGSSSTLTDVDMLPKKVAAPSILEKKSLLPVLDCNYNLREICKQCILLEDHLTQKEKRCEDCCIKHFLAIEALSEEALSLDKEQQYLAKIEELPNKIRKIQKMWLDNKDLNAHECSQMLREIRKSLMEECFSVIFESKKQCDGNKCKI